jgi:Secretion system C-terminal sorting domain/FG-GAP-like repeat
MRKTLTLFAALLLTVILSTNLFSQNYAKVKGPNVTIGGNQLPMAWAGGLNAPIFSTTDLDGDGDKDLVAFAIQNGGSYPGGYRISTFENKGTANTVDYVYAPQFIDKFPEVHNWMIMADYNCDGKEDIFSYSYYGGMEVYRNDFSIATGLRFTQVSSLVYSTYLGGSFANLYVAPNSLPVLVDVNGDGDMDVLTFRLLGVSVEYHENQSMELYGFCDSLRFSQVADCFGHFYMSSFSNKAVLNCYANCDTIPAHQPIEERLNSVLHSGSCMIALDNQADGDVDLINGDVLGNNLLYLENGGTIPGVNDSMIYQDTLYPAYNIPVDYTTFPAPYYFDANNDGKKDLIVSSCLEAQSENYNNIKYYKNSTNNTTNVFNFEQNRFLVDQMIDVGSGANVCIRDVDGDGKKDLLVGNFGYLRTNQNIFESGISYYRNTGSAKCPEFTLMTNDYANVFSLGLINVYPTFGDLDNDGDDDMLVGANDGMLYLFTNNGGSMALSSIQYQAIDVGNAATPQIIDVDRDGLLDLILGNAYGTIFYYRNTGTLTNPVFTYVTDLLGGVDVTKPLVGQFGYSQPLLYDDGGSYKLLVASEEGHLFSYDNIDGNLTGNFNLLSNNTYNIHEPYRATVARGDLDNDGQPELIIGNFAGGLNYYTKNDNCVTGINTVAQQNTISVYPNPSNGNVVIELLSANATESTVTITDAIGRIIAQQKLNAFKNIINLSKEANGVYFVKVANNSSTTVKKIMLKK